ncbi:MAG: long-chain fatty acid--CoA ligase [Spirosomataceae bacterium]
MNSPASTTNQELPYQRVFDLLDKYVANHNNAEALAGKEHGDWRIYSASEMLDTINKISIGLLKLGIKKDDKIAIISPNRPEWNIIDFGIQQIGAVSVPMYPTITIEDYRYIFQDAGVKIIFVGTKELYEKAKEATKDLDGIEQIYTFDEIKGIANWKEVVKLGEGEDVSQLEPLKDSVKSDDLLTLIYTSGTTGVPKGVMLTHGNIVSNVKGVMDYIPIHNKERVLSFLPLCHIYERTVIYIYLRVGASIFYAESMDTIADNLREVKPVCFSTVPRLLEKVYDKIVSKGHELTGLKHSLFFWALNLGLQYDPAKNMGWWYNVQLNLARKLIFSKWKEALGGNVRLIVSGSAALQSRLSKVFWAAGIPVSEGYGLTETSPVISTSKVEPFDMRIGCVGTVIPGVTVKIAEDGEILVKGPNIMKGYYNKPDKTAEVLDEEGWFHTGDIGMFVEGKYLKITDRKKEIFKTSGGKYVAPQLIENKLKESIYIEQVMVVGEGQRFPGALIVPEFEQLKKFCQEKGIKTTEPTEIVKQSEVNALLKEEVNNMNKNFAQYEQIKKIELLSKPFTIDSGELTPTLKLKRKVILEKYKNLVDTMYA